MTARIAAIALLALSPSLPAHAGESDRYCGVDVPYDVLMAGDSALVLRGESSTSCTVEDGELRCEDGAEIPFVIEDDELVLHTGHPTMPVVMPRCE